MKTGKRIGREGAGKNHKNKDQNQDKTKTLP
jgi:hypothetical protein